MPDTTTSTSTQVPCEARGHSPEPGKQRTPRERIWLGFCLSFPSALQFNKRGVFLFHPASSISRELIERISWDTEPFTSYRWYSFRPGNSFLISTYIIPLSPIRSPGGRYAASGRGNRTRNGVVPYLTWAQARKTRHGTGP